MLHGRAGIHAIVEQENEGDSNNSNSLVTDSELLEDSDSHDEETKGETTLTPVISQQDLNNVSAQISIAMGRNKRR